ncbi:MAG TPA: glycoside hydrolase family 32 protein [Verrucomicrobiae bacterium]|nr:glycoside hydrolase family 32 protein [Verrucomicrobiae bacterium]
MALGAALRFACFCEVHATEPFRPHYHFTPEKNWVNDPNGLVFYQGEYHLFTQYNPFGDKWGHMSWGHALSPDLVHWRELPVAIPESGGTMIFSGSAVVDWHNSSGFGTARQPPLVAIYTGNRTSDGRQAQCIASSTDRGRNWNKFSGNPVLDVGSDNFRDPKVFWHEPTHRWVMVVSMAAQRRIEFYGSPNLRNWTLLSAFGPAGSTNGVWECPDLFPLHTDGTPSRSAWVLIVNVGTGSPAGGSGTQYFVGDFDGETFKPASTAKSSEPLWADYGRDCYAAVSWSDIPKTDGRRIWLGWMSNWEYAGDVPTAPWRNAVTIPRELSLRDTGQGMRLVQQPVRELRRLRGRRSGFGGGSIDKANQWLRKKNIRGDSVELDAVFEPGHNGQCGIRVLKSADEQTVLGFDEVSQRVFVDRAHSGNVSFNKAFPGIHHAASRVIAGTVHFHVLIDACSIELFVNDGELVFTDLVFPSQSGRDIEFFARASAPLIRSAEEWPLRPAFAGR